MNTLTYDWTEEQKAAFCQAWHELPSHDDIPADTLEVAYELGLVTRPFIKATLEFDGKHYRGAFFLIGDAHE